MTGDGTVEASDYAKAGNNGNDCSVVRFLADDRLITLSPGAARRILGYETCLHRVKDSTARYLIFLPTSTALVTHSSCRDPANSLLAFTMPSSSLILPIGLRHVQPAQNREDLPVAVVPPEGWEDVLGPGPEQNTLTLVMSPYGNDHQKSTQYGAGTRGGGGNFALAHAGQPLGKDETMREGRFGSQAQ
ncbi:hypothetical protein LA080_003989 [Diaporthe eres]|nr:hypothetical protein LA080_003989 [Diaporthe eres]